MSRYRFATRELIGAIVATIIYVLTEWGQWTLINMEVVKPEIIESLHLPIFVVTIAAALFGPVVAMISAVGGCILSNVLYYGQISAIQIITHAIFGYLMGRFSYKYRILEGKFSGMAIIDYNVVQIFTNIICSIVIFPLLQFILGEVNLYEIIERGAVKAFGSIVIAGVLGTAVLYATNLVCRQRK